MRLLLQPSHDGKPVHYTATDTAILPVERKIKGYQQEPILTGYLEMQIRFPTKPRGGVDLLRRLGIWGMRECRLGGYSCVGRIHDFALIFEFPCLPYHVVIDAVLTQRFPLSKRWRQQWECWSGSESLREPPRPERGQRAPQPWAPPPRRPQHPWRPRPRAQQACLRPSLRASPQTWTSCVRPAILVSIARKPKVRERDGVNLP